MKKIFLLFILFISLFANGTIRTVSNTPSTLAQFNTIQAAINASISGDTVYVHGSPNAYAAFTITDKRLVIIGPGWAPNKNLPFTAIVLGFTISGTASSNTEFQGLVFGDQINMNNLPLSNNLRFIRNQFNPVFILLQGSGTYSGYLFEGNFFNGVIIGNAAATYLNFIFQNNVIPGGSGSSFNSMINSVNVLFNHNLWLGPASGSADCFSGSCGFFTFTNNIFVRRNAATSNSNSTFSNNITFNAGNNTPWASNGNVDGGGNVANQDPQMVDQTAVNAGTNNPLLDFTIPAGPANNTGSDGKDMGLLYDAIGSLNWAISRGSRLPFIFSMNIINPTISAGGTLNVVVEARKNN